jgi:osmotically-inducible protein OsmY
MADRQLRRDEADPSRGELDQLNFDHHREERHRLIGTSRANHERSSSDDRANGHGDRGWRDDGGSRSFSSGSQEFGRQVYGGGSGEVRYGAREWPSTETWRVPGPFAGRGPRGYQRADDRIREELNDRLTAHGFIDATDIECSVHNGDVTLTGFVDSPETKRAAEYVAEGIQGVHNVHNNLRIRSRQDAERIEAPNAPRPLESRSRTAARSGDSDTRRSRARTK